MNSGDLEAAVESLDRFYAEADQRTNPGMCCHCAQAWPREEVLGKLVEAAESLLNEKNYDGHGHELIETAVRRGKGILAGSE